MRTFRFRAVTNLDKVDKRQPNWTTTEITVLVQDVASNIRTMKGKFTLSLTNEVKNRCWAKSNVKVSMLQTEYIFYLIFALTNIF